MSKISNHLLELYRYRVLIWSLTWRAIKARYRGSVLGYFWTLLNPFLLLVVYRLVFDQFTHAVSMKNYALFLLVGILPWLWLSTSIGNGSTSIAGGGGLITRVCIPPQILPAVEVLANLVNFVFSLPVAVAAGWYYGVRPSPALLFLPLVILLQLILLYGFTLFLASVTVFFRDVQFLVQNLLMFWFFLTPIAYPHTIVPVHFRAFVMANPATSLVVSFQDMLYQRAIPQASILLLAAAWGIVILIAGILIYESLRGALVEEI